MVQVPFLRTRYGISGCTATLDAFCENADQPQGKGAQVSYTLQPDFSVVV